jgi:hypothetical protein
MERIYEGINDGGRLTNQALREPWRYGKGPLFGHYKEELKRRPMAQRTMPRTR